ncbi:putative ABC transport system permease protein [Nocardiopsis mwathae]|uniref:Putative ABC transport system permease protein n=1 Tax=Nocardiopsis mwathae TaxID=1472723 RepID=A0A7W9YKK2_9ACTN|nr:ABC transporter permease [Nocardiopsis mwathae]MBB6173236.1 putative ABC transport system permease protein [Nocardiopsis mwathae]
MLRSLIAGLVLAFAGSRANVSRTILSCAGIVVGVASLITVVTAGDVGERFAESYTESNFGVAETFQVDIMGERVTDLDALETDLKRAGATTVSMLHRPEGELRMRAGGRLIDDADTFVVDADLGDIRRINMVAGRWFTEADDTSLAPVVVVNENLASEIGDTAELQIGTGEWVDARVVGIIEATAMDGGWNTAYVLRSAASDPVLFPGGPPDGDTGDFTMLGYTVRTEPGTVTDTEYVERLASASWRWGVERKDSIQVMRSDSAEVMDRMLGYMSLGLFGIAAITLATGMLGVLNVGLVTVRERRRELATYRALGANRFTLFITVVAESVVVSIVAGAVALALCYAGAAAADVYARDLLPSDVTLYVPFQGVLVGLGSAAGVGLLAGIIPAWRALGASVVAGLRE